MDTQTLVRRAIKKYGGSMQLANSLGISYWTIRRWESGKVRPLPIYLKKLEESLNADR